MAKALDLVNAAFPIIATGDNAQEQLAALEMLTILVNRNVASAPTAVINSSITDK